MKQRITIEQLNELSGEQKERLKDLWEPQVGDWYACWNMHTKKYSESLYFVVEEDTYYNNEPDKTDKDLPLLSIGQCIQFLYEQNQTMDGVELKVYNFQGNTLALPFVNSVPIYKSGDAYSEHEFFNEPIDALWEAVKGVL